MAIIELARTDVVTVAPDADAAAVASLMDEASVGSVVVVEDGRPVGLVTDRDLALAVVSRGADPASLDASDVMSADPFTVHEGESIYDVLSATSEAGVRRVPVVDDDGALAGIVTFDDFLVLLASEVGNLSAIVQAESPPY